MNKAYKYTLTANEHKEITFDVGVNRLAISNANGYDGDVTIVTSEITKTKSGSIVSFDDGADAPFAELTVNITAQQSGSGDPSPENIRPITGWNGANVYVSGEDTIDPTTYPISWQSTAGTVYGGQIKPLMGELTATHYMYDLASLTYGETSSATGYKRGYFVANNASRDASGINMICSHVKGSYNGSGTKNESVCSEIAGYIYLQLSDETLNGLTIKQYVDEQHDNGTPVIVVGKLVTPVTYQLTSVEVRSLLGINNVWADCGAITELKYFVQSTQPLFDYINDEDDRCVYIDCAQTGADTFSITSDITKAEFVSLLNKNKNVKLRLDTGSADVIFDLSYVTANFADFTYNRTALISDVNTFQSMTLRVDMSGDTLSLSRNAVITIGDGTYEYVAGQNNQLIKDGWSWSTQGYSLTDADELLFMITPMPNVASDSNTINGELQRGTNDPKRALFCKGIKNMLPDVQEIESPFWFNDIVVVGNRGTYTAKNDIIMKIRVWAKYYNSSDPSLADVNFYANCDCNDSTANLWPMCNVFVFKKKR